MNNTCVISSYCSIRDNKVVADDILLFMDKSEDFGCFSTAIYNHFSIGYPKFHKMDSLAKLGFLSAEILLRNKEITCKYPAASIGVILCNSSSSLGSDLNHQKMISGRTEYFPSPAVFVYTLPNVVIGEICIKHKIHGEGNFLVMEKFNPLLLTDCISCLFNNKIIECCITGWVETDGSNYESVVYLIEKRDETITGIANFEPASILDIYYRR